MSLWIYLQRPAEISSPHFLGPSSCTDTGLSEAASSGFTLFLFLLLLLECSTMSEGVIVQASGTCQEAARR